ncbi:MAG: hypothetical protein HOD92_16450, partial [Deltaproteobacteria bacterium]|nr:hypothetical protein [Deltaproteobacteria bacterium]
MNDILKLRQDVENLLNEIKKLLTSHNWDTRNQDHANKWDEMVKKSVKLHKLVKPKHHKYMIENRGYDPDNPEFYNHIHPIEDLIAFIDDPNANDDPEDVTIDHEFKFPVYTRRWGHEDFYKVVRTSSGWNIGHLRIKGDCDKGGRPAL